MGVLNSAERRRCSCGDSRPGGPSGAKLRRFLFASGRIRPPNSGPSTDLVCNSRCLQSPPQYNLRRRAVFGGCFRWVLDAVCETVEWLSQPLGFDSLALRSHSTKCNMLDNAAGRVILKVFRRRRSVPSFTKPRPTIGAVLFVPCEAGGRFAAPLRGVNRKGAFIAALKALRQPKSS